MGVNGLVTTVNGMITGSGGGQYPFKPQTYTGVERASWEPNKVYGYTDGHPYNYAGDYLDGYVPNTKPLAGTPAPTTNNTAPAGPTAAQIAAQQKAAADAAAGRAINAGFDQVIGTYDRQLADLPGQVDSANRIVGLNYDSQKGSIESGYGRGVANLDYAANDITTKTGRGIRDLAESIRNSFNSYDTLIGARGGGDSSATGQLSYALQKEQAKSRTALYNNANDNLGQIALKRGDLDAQKNDQINQLNTWKATQIETIGQQFLAAQRQIEAAKAGASKDKLVALASLNQDLVNQAISALSGVEAQHSATTNAIMSSVKAASAPGDATKLAATNYTPTAGPNITQPTISMGGATPDDSFGLAVPYYKRLQGAGV